MRRARITFPTAWHHAMNRGLNKTTIFEDDPDRLYFLQSLQELSNRYLIKIVAYCLMDNHYHLVLQNTSRKMSEFMKALNSLYATHYRKKYGGTGYLFQNRFKSTLIQDNEYLSMAIIYTLINPVRAGLVGTAANFRWSSLVTHRIGVNSPPLIDLELINNLFGNTQELQEQLRVWSSRTELEIHKSDFGSYLGCEEFFEAAKEKFERRKASSGHERNRKNDKGIMTADEVLIGIEKEYGISINRLDCSTSKGKKIREKFLLRLKDLASLRYRDIGLYKPFQRLKTASLAQIYKRAKMS